MCKAGSAKRAILDAAYKTKAATMRSNVSGSPSVSVIIPCRNEIDHIGSCLSSIFDQCEVPGGFEVIVADGMSDDGTREILKRLSKEDSRLTVVDNPGGFVSSGLNAALRDARGSIIIRMDAHTSYAPDYIRQCVRVLQETGADNVGGPWVARGKGEVGMAIAAAFKSPFGSGGARGHDPKYSGPVDTVYLGCWHRELFDRIGMFDEELVRNQDDEFNLRLVRSGGKVWQSIAIKSCYHPRESLRHLFKQYLQYGYWKARVLKKHRLPASVRHLVPSVFVLMLALLPLMALFWSHFLWAWLALLGAYLIANISVSIQTAAANGWKLFPLFPCVFAIFHFGYGLGFLKGFADFVVLRRKASQSYSVLTRPSNDQFVP
jgi:succinoglycan biosynthesis protein ExoA